MHWHQNFHQVHNADISSSSVFSSFWGAFSGALFAFLFGIATYVIAKRRERFIQHKNAIIKLERMLNRHLDELAILEKIIGDTSAILKLGKLTSNRLFGFKMPEGLDLELYSLDLVNRLFSYQSHINRLDFDVLSLNHSLTLFENILIGGGTLNAQNLDFANRMLGGLSKEMPLLENEIKDFLAITRLYLIKTKENESFVRSVFRKNWNFEFTSTEILKEKMELNKEIEQTSQKK